MGRSKCGRKNRQGKPCQQPAGWGTDHVGQGACKLHGGKSTGAPKGNKNAVKTGEHETIWFDTLDDDERLLFDRIAVDVLNQLDSELRLVTIRERRMLQRIRRLSEEAFVVTEETEIREKTIAMGEDGELKPAEIVRQTKTQEAALLQIQAIEEALTRVQREKARLLDLKHKIESGKGPEEPDIEKYLKALEASAKVAWSAEDEAGGDDDAED